MSKRLIVTSGDVSDVDGFLALEKYFRTGIDVLFVMNYPGYIEGKECVRELELGQGFEFSAKDVFENTKGQNEAYARSHFRYQDIRSDNEKMKKMLTDLAFGIVSRLWKASQTSGNEFFFYVGGVNKVNPFSPSSVKNELLLFNEFIPDPSPRLQCKEGNIYGSAGKRCTLKLKDYSAIYMDFNGSMASMRPGSILLEEVTQVVDRLIAVFIMGGVLADAPAQTMPSIPGKLNRLSAATMNQLYHPPGTAAFFQLLKDNPAVEVYVVSNNAVHDLTTWDGPEKKSKTYDGVEGFLKANELTGPLLKSLAHAYYQTPFYTAAPPPRKAFDVYTAAALRLRLESSAPLPAQSRRLYFCGRTGVTLVASDPRRSPDRAGGGSGGAGEAAGRTGGQGGGGWDTGERGGGGWEAAVGAYLGGLDLVEREGDSDFVRGKKRAFRQEADLLRALPPLPSLPVRSLHPTLIDSRLSFSPASPRPPFASPRSPPTRFRSPTRLPPHSPPAAPAPAHGPQPR